MIISLVSSVWRTVTNLWDEHRPVSKLESHLGLSPEEVVGFRKARHGIDRGKVRAEVKRHVEYYKQKRREDQGK